MFIKSSLTFFLKALLCLTLFVYFFYDLCDPFDNFSQRVIL